MQTYRVEKILAKNHRLTLSGLPFRAGEKVEVIILGQPRQMERGKNYSLRGQSIQYIQPLEAVDENEWSALK